MLRRRLAPTLLLLPLLSAPAHATGGGTVLPFNDTLSLIQDNITGPTANTVVVVVFVGGLIGLAVSRENAWLKVLGGIAIICALIAKAPAVMTALGLGGAPLQPFTYASAQVLVCTAFALGVALTFLPILLLGERHSRSTNSAR
jgi:type IV secretory pathway VirB2 component (pilin)